MLTRSAAAPARGQPSACALCMQAQHAHAGGRRTALGRLPPRHPPSGLPSGRPAQRLLDYITPDFVHVMIDGRIVETGGKARACLFVGTPLVMRSRPAQLQAPAWARPLVVHF